MNKTLHASRLLLFLLLAIAPTLSIAQPSSPTIYSNNVTQAGAKEAVKHLYWGMWDERACARIATNGLKNSIRIDRDNGYDRIYGLADGTALRLGYEKRTFPKDIWDSDAQLQRAFIQTHGTSIELQRVSIESNGVPLPNPFLILNGLPFYGRYSTNVFLAYYVYGKPLRILSPDRANCLTNGVSFKEIVDRLGPGWKSPGDGIGLARWVFTNRTFVEVRIPLVKDTTKPLTNAFHWHTNEASFGYDDPLFPYPRARYMMW